MNSLTHSILQQLGALAVSHALVPPGCPLCSRRAATRALCTLCRPVPIVWSPHYNCRTCSAPLLSCPPETGVDRAQCINCSRIPLPFRWFASGFEYNSRCREALHAIKYENRKPVLFELLKMAEPVTSSLLEVLIDSELSVVPIPAGATTLASRGFDQGVEIALHLHKQWPTTTIHRFGLHYLRTTKPQATLPLSKRQSNRKRVFSACSTLRGKRILLVDDVWTTGATIIDASRALQEQEAEVVGVFTLARIARWQQSFALESTLLPKAVSRRWLEPLPPNDLR